MRQLCEKQWKKLAPLEKIQNQCLRRITGGYKRTPIAALERETQVMPLRIYTDLITRQRAVKTQAHAVEGNIRQAANTVWTRMRRARYPAAPPML